MKRGRSISTSIFPVLALLALAFAEASGVESASRSKAANHWAFKPVHRPALPAVSDGSWARNPIDLFVLARLEREGISPAPEADRATLIRRLSLDLLGLPPELEEIDRFLDDGWPGATERLVERLLASPAYGERWGRHWLDQARYADSNGYTIDGSRSIWKYRDWVVAALNADLPFDRFAIEQIAGDLLPGATLEQRIATGFHRNTLRNEEGGTDQEQFRVEAVADRVNTTGAVFLGLTLGCARCHDHKYDPISQREYFQVFAIFNNADEPSLEVPAGGTSKELPSLSVEIATVEKQLADGEKSVAARQADWEKKMVLLLSHAPSETATSKEGPPKEVAALPPEVRRIILTPDDRRSAAEKDRLAAHYRSIDPERVVLVQRLSDLRKRQEQLARGVTTTLVMQERPEPRPTHLHRRGDFLQPGERVEGGVPAALPPLRPAGARPTRLDLARWLVDPENPLTARVTVNRLWQAYFGRGLAATENDFGAQGAPPSHPELLDWLASEFMACGYSLKAMHRLIITSAAYCQSSRHRPELQSRDPENLLLARQARLRLEAEAVRDAALSASGLLSLEMGGPGVYPPQPKALFRFTQTAKYWTESQGADRYRRCLYTYFWRSSPYPLLAVFDAPDATQTCTRRARSNTPLQALTLANDPAFVEMAQALAARLWLEEPSGDGARLRRGFRLCLGRDPEDREAGRLLSFLNAQRRAFAAAPEDAAKVMANAPVRFPRGLEAYESAAWTALARVLLNLDELIVRE